MARVYSALASVGNRATSNQDDTYIEIKVPADVTIRIKRISFADGSGTNTALIAESAIRIKLLETSTTMTGGAAFTPVKRNPNTSSSACTVKVRTLATDTNTNGTIVRTFDQISLRNLFTFEWTARDLTDAITINGSATTFFDLVVSKSGTSVQVKTVSVTWEEF
jgi:hypothetical protein